MNFFIPLASMGPPIFIGGNRSQPHTRIPKLRLQWGRRFSSAEIYASICVLDNASKASMGPPIFIGGNPARTCTARTCATRFNGAADFHRRKWCASIWTRTRPKSFNGAADFHRRKLIHLIRKNFFCSIASMGPPIFIGGNPLSASPFFFIRKLQWGRRFSSAEMLQNI